MAAGHERRPDHDEREGDPARGRRAPGDIELFNAGDLEGVAELYAPDAVLAFPPGKETVGRPAIRAVYEHIRAKGARFKPEEPLPTVCHGDLALTSTRSADNTGVRVQVLRRQPDGSWLRVIDRPESK